MSITVYTKPNCQGCNLTKRLLDKQGSDYKLIDITEDPAAMERIKELGYLQAPVVETPTETWSGFRPDKITKLAD